MRLEIDIDATPDEVFDLYVDPDRRSEWNPAARSVDIEEGAINEAGSRYRVDTRYGQLIVDVLEIDRPHLYRLRERFGSSDSEATIRFEPRTDGGCRVVSDVTYTVSAGSRGCCVAIGVGLLEQLEPGFLEPRQHR